MASEAARRANMIAKPPKRARLTPEERRARACRDRGAKLLLSAYRFLESEEFAHLPLAAQEELRDDICELEDLDKTLAADIETLNAKYRILRAVAIKATAKDPDLQRQFLAVLDSDDD